MFESFGELLIGYVKQLGGLGVLLGILLETFIAPIPSPLIPIAAGFILIPTNVSLYEAIIISSTTIALFGSIGATFGAYFGYSIGRFGGRPILDRFGQYIGINWDDVNKIERLTERYQRDVTLLLSRIIPIIPLSPISFFSGLIRFNLIKFSVFTFIGCLPRYFVLGLIGWWTGIAYYGFVETIGFMEDLTLLLLIVGVIIYLVFIKLKKNRELNFSVRNQNYSLHIYLID